MYNKNERGEISKDEYIRMYKQIALNLRPKLKATEVLKIAEEDWLKDCEGGATLSEAKLQKVTFDFVDIWVSSISEKDYTMFLDTLILKIKKPGAFNPNAYNVLFE